jgi:hypothetical protein
MGAGEIAVPTAADEASGDTRLAVLLSICSRSG